MHHLTNASAVNSLLQDHQGWQRSPFTADGGIPNHALVGRVQSRTVRCLDSDAFRAEAM